MSPAILLLTALAAPTPVEAGPKAPRVLCLGGPLTEIVYALGAEDRLVGVDRTSIYPPAARKKPNVGLYRSFSAEGALAVSPDLVLAMEGAGPPSALEALEAAGVRVEWLPDAQDIDAARARVKKLGALLGREAAAAKLLAGMPTEPPPPLDGAPSVLFVYARGGGTLNVSGADTAADAMIRLAGAKNAVTAYEGFRPLTSEALVKAAPDVILVTTHGLASIGGVAGLLELPGVALTPAGRARRIVAMPDLLLLGFGPRLGEALGTLRSGVTGEPKRGQAR